MSNLVATLETRGCPFSISRLIVCSFLVICGLFSLSCLIFNMATPEETLAEYEKLFAKRFTSEDEEYMKTVNRTQASPPCLSDWLNTGHRDR